MVWKECVALVVYEIEHILTIFAAAKIITTDLSLNYT